MYHKMRKAPKVFPLKIINEKNKPPWNKNRKARADKNKADVSRKKGRKEEKERQSFDKIPINWISQKTTD